MAAIAPSACDPGNPARPGDPAPQFTASALTGERFALASLEGRVVLLNVWATWCGPCVREMPALQRVYEDYGARGLEVVGVSIDGTFARDDIESFIDRHGITFPIIHDAQQSVVTTFRTVGVPETFLIDRNGTIADRFFGEFDPTAPETRTRMETLLRATSP